MKEYFLLKRDRRYGNAPTPINFFFELGGRKINRKDAYKLPGRTIVDIEKRSEYDRVDLIDGSLFLVSDAVKNVFSFYDDEIFFKTVVLMIGDGSVQMKYNLPIFKEIACFRESGERAGTVVKKIVLARDSIGTGSIFKIAETRQRHIIVRLDVAESLLRRKLRGLSFTETEVR
jgi:hypothetical protein